MDPDELAVWILMLACGIVCILIGKKYQSYGVSVEKLWTMVSEGSTDAVDTYASECGLPQEDVREIIQEWIRTQKLTNVNIDRDNKNVVSTLKTYSVKCPNCGAVNTITEDNRICEYCGSTIEVDM